MPTAFTAPIPPGISQICQFGQSRIEGFGLFPAGGECVPLVSCWRVWGDVKGSPVTPLSLCKSWGHFPSPPMGTAMLMTAARDVIKVGLSLPTLPCAGGGMDAPHHGNGSARHRRQFQVLGQSLALIDVLLDAELCHCLVVSLK